jgi:hypothetical protein
MTAEDPDFKVAPEEVVDHINGLSDEVGDFAADFVMRFLAFVSATQHFEPEEIDLLHGVVDLVDGCARHMRTRSGPRRDVTPAGLFTATIMPALDSMTDDGVREVVKLITDKCLSPPAAATAAEPGAVEPVAAGPEAATKTVDKPAARLTSPRERAEQNGFSLRRRGSKYLLCKPDMKHGHNDLDSLEAHLDVIERCRCAPPAPSACDLPEPDPVDAMTDAGFSAHIERFMTSDEGAGA